MRWSPKFVQANPLVWALALIASAAASAGPLAEPGSSGVPVSETDAGLAAAIEAGARRSTGWLLARQSADGAWYSETYGAFKDGWSLTPVALLALLYMPPEPAIAPAWRKGADFLASAVTADGRVRPGPAGYSYPTESLALSAIVLSMPPSARHHAARDALVAELRTRQLVAANGFAPDEPDFGGWGYGVARFSRPREGLPSDDPRSANLAATLLAVGALRFAGAGPDDPALGAARGFVRRCQNFGPDPVLDDGGFFFSPTGETTNKAGPAPGGGRVRFRSYGSMTADGFRALRLLMAPEDGPRLVAAADWLRRHFDPSRAAGDYAPDRALQRDAVYFYQSWSVAHALAESSPAEIDTARGRVRWGEALAPALLARQAADGHFRNPATDLREDDPLLATPLAMAALGLVRFHLSGRLEASIPMDAGR